MPESRFLERSGVFPAHVVTRASGAGSDDDELLALAKTMARNPAVITPESTYLWGAEISNNSLDSYFTRMAKSSLKNYADAANTGVAFLTGHDTKKLNMGRSVRGKFVNGQGDGKARVEADFYTLTDLNLNGVSTNDFIRGVEGGLVSDVSIGFHGGEWVCSVCGRDMMDWSDWDNICWHMPGVEYPKTDKKGRDTGEMILCTVDIENAGLSEVSAVYDGATPGASIRKALAMAEVGKLPSDLAQRMEARYHHRFKLTTDPVWSLGAIKNGARMTQRGEQATTPDDELEPIATAAELEADDPEPETPAAEPTEVSTDPTEPESPSDEGEADEETTDPNAAAETDDEGENDMELAEELRSVFSGAGLEALPDEPVAAARALVAEMQRLQPQAADGRAYRADLIDETVKEGIRAFGSDFPEEKRRATLAKLDLDEIKLFRDEWRAAGDARSAGGRQTDDDVEDGGVEEDERAEERDADEPLRFRSKSNKDLPNAAFQA